MSAMSPGLPRERRTRGLDGSATIDLPDGKSMRKRCVAVSSSISGLFGHLAASTWLREDGPLGTVGDVRLRHLLVVAHIGHVAAAGGGMEHALGGVSPGEADAARLLAHGHRRRDLVPGALVGQEQGQPVVVFADHASGCFFRDSRSAAAVRGATPRAAALVSASAAISWRIARSRASVTGLPEADEASYGATMRVERTIELHPVLGRRSSSPIDLCQAPPWPKSAPPARAPRSRSWCRRPPRPSGRRRRRISHATRARSARARIAGPVHDSG